MMQLDRMTRSGKRSPRGMLNILPQAVYSQNKILSITQRQSNGLVDQLFNLLIQANRIERDECGGKKTQV